MKIARGQLRRIIVEELDKVREAVDTDADGTPDYLDTDSDNDGISDSEESGTIPQSVEIVGEFMLQGNPWKTRPLIPQGESGFMVGYDPSGSSRGNRYVSYRGLVVRNPSGDEPARGELSPSDASKKLGSYGAQQYRTMLDGLASGVFVGPKLTQAVRDLAEAISQGGEVSDVRAALEPVGKAFWEDARDGTLFSDNYEYTETSHSGWSRST
jgi:hypothetical protein